MSMDWYEEETESAWSGGGFDSTSDFEENTTVSDDGTVDYHNEYDDLDTTTTSDNDSSDEIGDAWSGTEYDSTSDWEDSHTEQDGVHYNTDKDEIQTRQESKQRDAQRGLLDNYKSPMDWMKQEVSTKAAAAIGLGVAAVYLSGD